MTTEQQPQQPKRTGIGDGIRTGVGVLNAFREAIEETVSEAMERGDVSPERAKTMMRDAAQRVQSSFDETRERFDFAARREFEALKEEVAALRSRVEALEARADSGITSESDLGLDAEAPGTEASDDIIIVSE